MSEIPLNQIIHADCMDIMADIPDKYFDLIITDPPYSIGTTSNGHQGEWHDNNLIRPFFKNLFREFHRLLKDGREFYINTDWRTYQFLYPLIYDSGLKIKNCIVWDYEWIKAGTHYRFSHEFIIYGIKGVNKRRFSNSARDVWRIPPVNFTAKKYHHAEKPIKLLKEMILNSSSARDIIFDPFCGSATTAIACDMLDRQFVTIEISEKHYHMACDRFAIYKSQGRLF